jgi:potassium-dependent mechanosensitive channel
VVKSKTSLKLLIYLFLAACLPCAAQLNDLYKQFAGSPAADGKATPDLRAQLEKWKIEADSELAKLERYDNGEALPDGVTASDLSSRRRSLEQTLLAISRHLVMLDDTRESSTVLKAAQAEADGWKGFKTPPPYSALMVDEWLERKEALQGKLVSNRSSAEVFKTTLSGLLKDAKGAAENVDVAFKAVGQADKNDPVLPWKLDTARVRQRSIFIRASALQHGIASLEELMRANEVEIALISRKISAVGDDLIFSEEELGKIKAANADRLAGLKKEASDVRKRQRKAEGEKSATSAALAKLKESPEPDPVAIELGELNDQTAAVALEALQSISDSLDSFIQIESFVPEAYEARFTLISSQAATERKAALENLATLSQRLEAWEVVAGNQLYSVAADIGKQQSGASLLQADDPRLVPLERQRTILWEKQAVIQRAHQAIISQRRTMSRWLAEYELEESAPWYAPVTKTVSRTWAAVKKIWNIPVNRYEETIEIDGQKVSQVRFVSLGTIIVALILFIIAYFIAVMISRRLQRIMIQRGFIGEAQARTLRNWLMLIVAVLLALATLNWLSIPLTIFAFLAGALAIGVGFGTQTIIKNFISGIILLFERKVRVGDIIEVDGINGVVSEINTRSSIVRGFNGIENLIPNSLFLENRVVNWTLNSRLLRREIQVPVAYGSPTQKIIDILNEAAARHGLILKNPEPIAVFSNFSANSLDFTLLFWIELNDKTNGLVVDSDLRIIIEKKLTEIGIGVPSPQRDTHLSTDHPIQIEITRKRNEAAPQKEEKPEIP